MPRSPKKLMALVAFMCGILWLAPAHANLWRILPGENLASLVQSKGAMITGSDLERLDPGVVVVMTYLQAGPEVYRCVEYVTEFQFDLLRAACFMALNPPPAAAAK